MSTASKRTTLWRPIAEALLALALSAAIAAAAILALTAALLGGSREFMYLRF